MAHRPKPEARAPRLDPDVIHQLAIRLKAAVFAARWGTTFESEIEEGFISAAERTLWTDLAIDMLAAVEICGALTIH